MIRVCIFEELFLAGIQSFDKFSIRFRWNQVNKTISDLEEDLSEDEEVKFFLIKNFFLGEFN